ncbi:MAG: hypothetical protein LBK12_03460, partial [Odoribacteraceae bacterium]|nr:hypothetical protein [Odoribacteraceae bacterium]
MKIRMIISCCFLFFLVIPRYGAVAAVDEFPSHPRRASGVSQEKSRFRHEQWIIPSVLMTYGTIEASMGRKLRLLNRVIGGKITARPPAKIRVDDYSQYLPIASAYTLDLAGIRGRHNLLAKTEILGTATLFLVATVNGMKYTVRERRPDRSAANSF